MAKMSNEEKKKAGETMKQWYKDHPEHKEKLSKGMKQFWKNIKGE